VIPANPAERLPDSRVFGIQRIACNPAGSCDLSDTTTQRRKGVAFPCCRQIRTDYFRRGGKAGVPFVELLRMPFGGKLVLDGIFADPRPPDFFSIEDGQSRSFPASAAMFVWPRVH
jgi:hypothetical protein